LLALPCLHLVNIDLDGSLGNLSNISSINSHINFNDLGGLDSLVADRFTSRSVDFAKSSRGTSVCVRTRERCK
jgi:hypothetical protein